jgi:hypothetical protein
MPRNKQDVHHAVALEIGRHGEMIHQNGRRAFKKDRLIPPEGLGRKITLFLLAYRASTHKTTGFTPASLVLGRELRLPCDLLFGASLPRNDPHFVDHLHDIHNYVCQHLKLVTDRMKTRYDRMANCVGYHGDDKVWLYRPTCTKGKSPNLQSSCEGPYKVVTWINNVYTGPWGTLDQGWWWYMCTDWLLIRESLGMSGSGWGVITMKTNPRGGRWDQA